MRKILVVVFAFALSLIATPAFAIDVYAYQGKDLAVVYDHAPRTLRVQDRECDRNPVKGQFYMRTDTGGEVGPYNVRDEDGCDGYAWEDGGAGRITKFRVGEQTNDGVWHWSGWKYGVINA